MAPNVPLEPSSTVSTFLRTSLATSSLRLDSRTLLSSRPLSLQFGPTEGWVLVTLGTTRVLAVTNAQLVPPRDDRPFEGFVELRAEVQPMAGVGFERGRANEEEVLFERALDRAVRRCEAVDRENLCVVAGQSVWSLTISVHLLSSCGNALDAAVLASIVSLRHFRRPDVSISGAASLPRRGMRKRGALSKQTLRVADRAKVEVHDPSERVPVKTNLHHHPLSVSFAVFVIGKKDLERAGVSSSGAVPKGEDDGEGDEAEDESNVKLLLDPSQLEERLADSTMHITMNVQGEVCGIDKSGGAPLGTTTLRRAIEIARKRVKELEDFVEGELERDGKGRVGEVL